MLLPAAFHFTLTYRDGSDNVQEQIAKQKEDILRRSHGVRPSLIILNPSVNHLFIGLRNLDFW